MQFLLLTRFLATQLLVNALTGEVPISDSSCPVRRLIVHLRANVASRKVYQRIENASEGTNALRLLRRFPQ